RIEHDKIQAEAQATLKGLKSASEREVIAVVINNIASEILTKKEEEVASSSKEGNEAKKETITKDLNTALASDIKSFIEEEEDFFFLEDVQDKITVQETIEKGKPETIQRKTNERMNKGITEELVDNILENFYGPHVESVEQIEQKDRDKQP